MREYLKFYINGAWVDPVTPKTLDVINPATEAVAGRISLGSAADVDAAVKAARSAFERAKRRGGRPSERHGGLEARMLEQIRRNLQLAERVASRPGRRKPGTG